MRLVRVGVASFERALPEQFRGYVVGQCQNLKPVANSTEKWRCRTQVTSATGFADADGTPFIDYYCPACAALLGAT